MLLRIVAGFEEALENGEFHIYLQPQVFGRGEIRGGEALVRWIRPDCTILMPGEFLDVLAQTELLSHLDRHVWERAVRLLSKWKGTALEDKFLSVNIDPMDFYYMDVPDTLCSLCRRYEVDPKKLRVEITEAALVEDPVRQNEIIDRLHKAGFLVEIDDFGKGYSSLSMLKDIHADILKVDMGFLRENEHRERSEVILESVIEMAGNLDMGVIVEGVETKEQMEKLMKMGCQRFQGFFFSRPIPVPDFEMIAGA
jgi:EAL domain-containing protein (putative c-di-GMP-specific phosphodiesterase class I)